MAGRTHATLFLRRLSDGANRLTIIVCAALLAVMLVLSAIGIALETARAASLGLGGSGEAFRTGFLGDLYANTRPSLIRVFLPWLGMLSITVAFKAREHVAITALAKALPRSLFRLTLLVNLVAVAAFAAALAWYGLAFTLSSSHLFIVSDTLQVSQRALAAAVPVAGVVLALHLADGFRLFETAGIEPDALEANRAGSGAVSLGETPAGRPGAAE